MTFISDIFIGNYASKTFHASKPRYFYIQKDCDRSALLRLAVAIVTNLLKRIAILHKHPQSRKYNTEVSTKRGSTLLFY